MIHEGLMEAEFVHSQTANASDEASLRVANIPIGTRKRIVR